MALINYSKTADSGSGSWSPLPEGVYDVRINAAQLGTSAKGNPQVRVTGEIIDGTYAGRNVNVWYSLLPQSTWKFDKLFQVLGISARETGEYDSTGSPILGVDSDDLIGRSVRYTVKQREYPAGSGKLTNDFGDEAASPFDEAGAVDEEPAPVAAAPAKTPAPAPAPAPAVENPALRRRPRPAGIPS